MKIEGAKVLITGGAGFVGSHIADLLINEKVSEIVIFDKFIRGTSKNLESAMARGPLRIITGDICDPKSVADAMQGIDLVFHQATLRLTQCAQEPRLAMQVMVDGTFNILEAAQKANVKKIIAASSAAVYGMAETFPTPETQSPYDNRTLYGATKTFNEGLLRSFYDMYKLPYVALRYFNVYGSRMDIATPHREVMILWLERIAQGKPPLIFGNGEQTMDFISVEDVARANILAAKSDITDEVFNIASGTENSLNDLAQALLDLMGSDLKPEYGPERKVNPVPRRLGDIQKAKRLLGFAPEISFNEGLARLHAWWKNSQKDLALATAEKGK